jgi:predicted PurR-regulated permease PerM
MFQNKTEKRKIYIISSIIFVFLVTYYQVLEYSVPVVVAVILCYDVSFSGKQTDHYSAVGTTEVPT